jgi:hypothetical protein
LPLWAEDRTPTYEGSAEGRQTMATNEPFFPDPDEAHRDGSLVGVFILALALMIGLTILIYYSGVWQAVGGFLVTMLGS